MSPLLQLKETGRQFASEACLQKHANAPGSASAPVRVLQLYATVIVVVDGPPSGFLWGQVDKYISLPDELSKPENIHIEERDDGIPVYAFRYHGEASNAIWATAGPFRSAGPWYGVQVFGPGPSRPYTERRQRCWSRIFQTRH